MATLEAIKKIREGLTPKVTLSELVDTGKEIIVKVKYHNRNLCLGVFTIKADRQGNIIYIEDC